MDKNLEKSLILSILSKHERSESRLFLARKFIFLNCFKKNEFLAPKLAKKTSNILFVIFESRKFFSGKNAYQNLLIQKAAEVFFQVQGQIKHLWCFFALINLLTLTYTRIRYAWLFHFSMHLLLQNGAQSVKHAGRYFEQFIKIAHSKNSSGSMRQKNLQGVKPSIKDNSSFKIIPKKN